MKLPTEAKVRTAASFALWGVSGGILLALFVTIAGPDFLPRLLAVVWALALMTGLVLTWRLPDARRFLALGLEIVVLASGYAMARNRIDLTAANSTEATLGRVRSSVEYQAALGELTRAQGLETILQNRLASLPADWTTAASKLSAEIQATAGQAQALTAKLTAMERTSGTTEGTGSMFDLFGHQNAGLVETIVLVILAVGTEALALALSGRAFVAQTGAQSNADHAEAARTDSAVHAEIDANTYLAEARRLGNGRSVGYRQVRDSLGITDHRARTLVRQLIGEGRINDPRKRTNAEER